MFNVKFQVLKSFLTSSEVIDLVTKTKISICIWLTIDQKLHMEVEFLQLRATTTNKLTIIIHKTNIPKAFALSSVNDWTLEPEELEPEEPELVEIQAPELRV